MECVITLAPDVGQRQSADLGAVHEGLFSVLGVRQAFTSYNNPKGNADTERMMRTLEGGVDLAAGMARPEEVSAVAESLDGKLQRELLAFGAWLQNAEPSRRNL